MKRASRLRAALKKNRTTSGADQRPPSGSRRESQGRRGRFRPAPIPGPSGLWIGAGAGGALPGRSLRMAEKVGLPKSISPYNASRRPNDSVMAFLGPPASTIKFRPAVRKLPLVPESRGQHPATSRTDVLMSMSTSLSSRSRGRPDTWARRRSVLRRQHSAPRGDQTVNPADVSGASRHIRAHRGARDSLATHHLTHRREVDREDFRSLTSRRPRICERKPTARTGAREQPGGNPAPILKEANDPASVRGCPSPAPQQETRTSPSGSSHEWAMAGRILSPSEATAGRSVPSLGAWPCPQPLFNQINGGPAEAPWAKGAKAGGGEAEKALCVPFPFPFPFSTRP